MLWSGGSTGALPDIEQIAYMIFMKESDAGGFRKEEDASALGISYTSIFPKDKPKYRRHTFKNLGNAQKLYEPITREIFPVMKNLKEDFEGTNGQFRTPRHIIKMMVKLAEPKTG